MRRLLVAAIAAALALCLAGCGGVNLDRTITCDYASWNVPSGWEEDSSGYESSARLSGLTTYMFSKPNSDDEFIIVSVTTDIKGDVDTPDEQMKSFANSVTSADRSCTYEDVDSSVIDGASAKTYKVRTVYSSGEEFETYQAYITRSRGVDMYIAASSKTLLDSVLSTLELC